MHLLLDTETYDDALLTDESPGVAVGIFDPRVVGLISANAIRLKPGSFYSIGLIPSLTVADPTIKSRFTPEQRQCYFDDEIHLYNVQNATSDNGFK